MTTSELVIMLEDQGVTLELSVRAKGNLTDDLRVLIREHRDLLIAYLQNVPMPGTLRVDLPKPIVHNLFIWINQYHELRILTPERLTLHATPKHITEAIAREGWGVVYKPDRGVFMNWGRVPVKELHSLTTVPRDELTQEAAN